MFSVISVLSNISFNKMIFIVLVDYDIPAWCFSRTVLSEKKTVLKPKSPEKTKPDEKDPEKSPAKKLEGQYNNILDF